MQGPSSLPSSPFCTPPSRVISTPIWFPQPSLAQIPPTSRPQSPHSGLSAPLIQFGPQNSASVLPAVHPHLCPEPCPSPDFPCLSAQGHHHPPHPLRQIHEGHTLSSSPSLPRGRELCHLTPVVPLNPVPTSPTPATLLRAQFSISLHMGPVDSLLTLLPETFFSKSTSEHPLLFWLLITSPQLIFKFGHM